MKAIRGLPYYAKNGKKGAPAHGRYLFLADTQSAHAVCAAMNSTLFYSFFVTYGDCFHLTDSITTGFPLVSSLTTDKGLIELDERLARDLRKQAERKTITTKDDDRISYDEFKVSESKPIIDDIDRVLARHYAFTDEELDFIINYDIKYRMGLSADQESEE